MIESEIQLGTAGHAHHDSSLHANLYPPRSCYAYAQRFFREDLFTFLYNDTYSDRCDNVHGYKEGDEGVQAPQYLCYGNIN